MLARFRRSLREAPGGRSLQGDARAMRATLDALHKEIAADRDFAEVNIRGLLRDMFTGEVSAPTTDVVALKRRGIDAEEFYARQVAPSWEGLSETQRAARVDGFLEMWSMLENAGDLPGVSVEMAESVRTRTLVLAWAFDETYGYLARLARGAPVGDAAR